MLIFIIFLICFHLRIQMLSIFIQATLCDYRRVEVATLSEIITKAKSILYSYYFTESASYFEIISTNYFELKYLRILSTNKILDE